MLLSLPLYIIEKLFLDDLWTDFLEMSHRTNIVEKGIVYFKFVVKVIKEALYSFKSFACQLTLNNNHDKLALNSQHESD